MIALWIISKIIFITKPKSTAVTNSWSKIPPRGRGSPGSKGVRCMIYEQIIVDGAYHFAHVKLKNMFGNNPV